MRRETMDRLNLLERLPAAAAPVEEEPLSCAAWLRGLFGQFLDVDADTRRVIARTDKLADVAAALNVDPLVLLSGDEVEAFLEAAAAGAFIMAWSTQGPTDRRYSPWPAWRAGGDSYPEGHTELCSAVHLAAWVWARQTGEQLPGELSGQLADVLNWLTDPDRVFVAD